MSACSKMESQLTLFAAASPAKTSHLPEPARALPASAPGSGQSSPALLARFDPATRSWRTSQLCWVEGLTLFSETWPRSGMTRNGTAYQLAPLVPLTRGTGSGLWPTPTLPNGGRTLHHVDEWRGRSAYHKGKKVQVDLAAAVKMWPTPTVSGNYNRKGASKASGDGLATAAGGALNPTWVEWLMGFPIGWTDCADSETP